MINQKIEEKLNELKTRLNALPQAKEVSVELSHSYPVQILKLGCTTDKQLFCFALRQDGHVFWGRSVGEEETLQSLGCLIEKAESLINKKGNLKLSALTKNSVFIGVSETAPI